MTKKRGKGHGMGSEALPGGRPVRDPGKVEREGEADRTRREQIDQNKVEAEDSLPLPKKGQDDSGE